MSKKSPQLRFEGFTDDWEERKLKELGDIQTGNTPPTSDSDNYSLDGVLWVTPTDIKSLVISNTAKKLSQVGVTKARIAKAGSILVTSIASIGKNTLLRMDAGFNQQINSLTPTSENDSYFLLTQSEKWSEKMKQTAASATMQIVNKTDFSNISTYVPVHKEEQEKIGSFFKQLDDTIALHQRKLDLLKEQKKGYLQKMFPKNGAKVPELRFAGFADDWEERKFFESIASTIDFRGRTPKKLGMDWSDSGYLALSALNVKNGYIDPLADAHYGDEKLYRKWMSGRELKKGQVLFTTEAPMGNVAQVPDDNGYILSQRTVAFETKEDMMTNDFLAVLLKSPLVFNNLSALSSGGTAKGVSQKSLKGLSITVPLDIDEQQKIGSFFKQLDNTIALHQRKLDLLKEQKKGFLQKMFPKNGAKVPELRFAGFADDWEERKLSDVANHRGGTAIEKYFDKDGAYKVISIGSYGLNSQYVDQNIRAISNEITDGRVVNSGELTMVLNDKTANGTIIGRSLLVEKDNEYVINQRTEIISPKENFDSNFAYTILNGPFREKVKRIVQGGTQIYVNYPAVSNLNLELPKIEEQQKIGSFFKQLDDTIALHQRKLDLLKEQKKGFLQKIFV